MYHVIISSILTKATCFDTKKVISTRKCPLKYNNYLIQANNYIPGPKIELIWLINDLKTFSESFWLIFGTTIAFWLSNCVEYINIMYSKQKICTFDVKMAPRRAI